MSEPDVHITPALQVLGGGLSTAYDVLKLRRVYPVAPPPLRQLASDTFEKHLTMTMQEAITTFSINWCHFYDDPISSRDFWPKQLKPWRPRLTAQDDLNRRLRAGILRMTEAKKEMWEPRP